LSQKRLHSLVFLLAAGAVSVPAAVVVAADGSGQYRSVQAAVEAAPENSGTRTVIRIKPGVYKERVVVPHNKPFLAFEGEDATTTILTNGLYASMADPSGPDPSGNPLGTFRTPSTTIEADDFVAENITFENSAGAKGQAVALAVLGDRGVFRNCRFLGWQDTLLTQWGRHYFENAYIEGAVDFIFGESTAFFDHRHIHAKGNGYITAASTPQDQPHGFVFSQCRITGEPGVKTDLGRPWRDYASVSFLDTEMTDVVRPAAWNNWSNPPREKTSRFAEYRSTGTGAIAPARVPWARQLTDQEARSLTAENVLAGADGWNPATGAARRLDLTEARAASTKTPPGYAYIAVAIRDGDKSLQFFYGKDGHNWKPFSSAAPPSADAAVAFSQDSGLHLVWAVGDRRLAHASSPDLRYWTTARYFDPMAGRNALGLEHPSIMYNPAVRQFTVTWASTIRDNLFQSYQENVDDNPRLWYTITRDFETFAPARLLFDPNYAVRDGTVARDVERYALLHQDSRRAVRQLRIAFGPSPSGPWGPSSDSFPRGLASRSNLLHRSGGWLIYYDSRSGPGATPGALETQDFWKFKDVTRSVTGLAGEHLLGIGEVPLEFIQKNLHVRSH
jgi:pectinesterase